MTTSIQILIKTKCKLKPEYPALPTIRPVGLARLRRRLKHCTKVAFYISTHYTGCYGGQENLRRIGIQEPCTNFSIHLHLRDYPDQFHYSAECTEKIYRIRIKATEITTKSPFSSQLLYNKHQEFILKSTN